LDDFDKFEQNRTNEFKAKTRNLYSKCTEDERREYNEFLKSVLAPRYGGHSRDMKNVGSFYDQGLFYHSPTGFECVSGPARNAVSPLLSAILQQNLPSISSVVVSLFNLKL
jgi:hypothetical protein